MEFRRAKFSQKCSVQNKTEDALAGISFSTNSHLASSPKLSVLTSDKLLVLTSPSCCGPGWVPVLCSCLVYRLRLVQGSVFPEKTENHRIVSIGRGLENQTKGFLNV